VAKKKSVRKIHNPIDKDQVTETPHTLPYPHTIGSAVIVPIDKRGVKGSSLATVEEQAEMQLNEIREQLELLLKQAKHIKERVAFSQQVYEADINFVPVIGEVYHMYEKTDGSYIISMIAPWEWKNIPYKSFTGSIKLLADRTWYPCSPKGK
jgi:ribosome maturation protein Sdo1